MKRLILPLTIVVQLLALIGCSIKTSDNGSDITQPISRLKRLAGDSISTTELEAFIEQIMEKGDVAGLSCAILNDSHIVYQKAFGY